MDMLVKWIVHVPGGMDRDGGRFHHGTQNNAKFQTHTLFNSRIFHLIFLDCDGLWVTNNENRKLR